MFPDWCKYLLLSLFTIPFSIKAPSYEPATLKKSISQNLNQIIRWQHSIKKKQQQIHKKHEQLIGMFKQVNHNDLDPIEMLLLIKALKKTKEFKEINPHYKMLKFATKSLYNAENFTHMMKMIVNNLSNKNTPSLNGYLYEIEKAVAIVEQDNGEQVLAFNKKIPSLANARNKREFDVVTNKRWIECKNITWGNQQKTQFLEQQKIVDEYNRRQNLGITYEIHSKRAIPDQWQQWFANNHISFFADETNAI